MYEWANASRGCSRRTLRPVVVKESTDSISKYSSKYSSTYSHPGTLLPISYICTYYTTYYITYIM